MKKPVIYKIRNVVNNKFYVGSTTNTRERFRNHRKTLRGGRHHCLHLQASWNKYGEDCFKFEVVEEVESEGLLWAAEDRWLDEHFGKPHCYNAGRSADAPMRGRVGPLSPNFGKPKTDAERQQISVALKEFYAKDYYNHPRVGKQHTEETKAKISAKVQQAVAEGRGGAFIPSEETRKKMSEALKGNQNAKGYKRTEAEREAIRQRTLGNQNFLGKTHTEEAKAKLRRPIYALLPDGTRRDFVGVFEAGQELDTPYQMLVRLCKSNKPVARGKFGGWQFFYADQEAKPVEIPEEYKHLPRTRQDAKAQGAKEYFTGLPCTHGHISPRLTKGTCVDCLKAEHKKSNDKKRLEIAYAHDEKHVAALLAVYTDAASKDSSEWPATLEYRGMRWGRHEVYTDVFWLPEELELALCRALTDKVEDLYWTHATQSFPPKTVKALKGFVAALQEG